MADIKNYISRITAKVQQLAKVYMVSKAENETLKKNIADANIKLKQQQQAIEELKQQLAIYKASAGSMAAADKKEFERRINKYLQQVDKTINILSDNG